MTRNRLLLANHTDGDLELTFLWARSERQPTTQCRIPFNGLVDVAHIFPKLSKREARAVIEASPDYLWFKKSTRVELIDETEQQERHAEVVRVQESLRILPEKSEALRELEAITALSPPPGDPSPPSNHPDTPPLPTTPGTTREDAARQREQEKVATKAFQEAQERAKNAPATSLQPGQTDAGAEPAADGALDPGMKEALADVIPSTRWTVERLQAYAAERDLDVAGMSKNAILRKIRGA